MKVRMIEECVESYPRQRRDIPGQYKSRGDRVMAQLAESAYLAVHAQYPFDRPALEFPG